MSRTVKRKPGILGSVAKVLKFIIGLACLALLGGYIAFAVYVAKSQPDLPVPSADGIVVLTGTGGGRLEAGGKLLHAGKGERLLISGVNPANDAATMQNLLGLAPDIFACCVDLDYVAENTYGNGQETEVWARALGYETILLVTSSYHMPRAKVELGAAHNGLTIIPYPVKALGEPDEPWWGGPERHKRLLKEYGKLLVAYARNPGARRSTAVIMSPDQE